MRRSLVFIIAIAFFVPNIFAAYDLEGVLLELERQEQAMQSIKFDFKQEINFAQAKNQTIITGEALFAKDGKLRINKLSPDKQITISDGKHVWVYNPAYNQVWEGSSRKWLDSSVLPKGMIPFNNYVTDLRKNFTLRLVDEMEDENGSLKILAQTKDLNLGYQLELSISPKSWLPTKTVYLSDSASVTTHMTKLEVNPVLSANVFTFSRPKGVESIPLN